MRNSFLFVIVLFLVTIASSCILFQPSYDEIWKKNSKNKYDVIIVPGIPFTPPNWNNIMKMRVHWSVMLYERGIAKNIIYTGSAVHTPYVESEIMSLYAQKLGVPKKNIFLESKAEHGSENLYYSIRLAQKLGFKKIALATDPYQAPLMTKHIHKFNFDLSILPVVFDTLFTLNLDTPTIDYQKAQVENFVKLSQKVGKIEQYQNSMGRRVKKAIKAEKKAERRAKKEVKQDE